MHVDQLSRLSRQIFKKTHPEGSLNSFSLRNNKDSLVLPGCQSLRLITALENRPEKQLNHFNLLVSKDIESPESLLKYILRPLNSLISKSVPPPTTQALSNLCFTHTPPSLLLPPHHTVSSSWSKACSPRLLCSQTCNSKKTSEVGANL